MSKKVITNESNVYFFDWSFYMKKNIIATLPLLALAATGTAFAQSSVTLFGNVDEAVTVIDGKNTWSGLNSGGSKDSYLGLRGVEDLGNGLKAQFWLESGINADTGTGDSSSGLDFKRRATVGVMGSFGELHLGRDETAAYKAMQGYDVFNHAGIGGSQSWGMGNNDDKRKDNLVAYVSPNFGGLTFSANYAFGETNQSTWKTKAYYDAAVSYAQGPWSATFAAEQQNNSLVGIQDTRQRAYSLGGGYDFGVVKLVGAYRQINNQPDGLSSYKDKTYTLGASAPVGAAGLVKASYNHYEYHAPGVADKYKADQIALGYEHNLSKRTALYGTYAFLKNKNDGQMALESAATLSDSGKQQGLQVGLRHAF